MPTPNVKGADSISQRTGGLRKPPSTAPRMTLRTAVAGLTSRCGLNPRSCMKRNATSSVTPSIAARMTYGTPRFVAWATTPPETVPTSIATPPTTWARPKTARGGR